MRKTICIILVFLICLTMVVPVVAADAVPSDVLDAATSVVRVLAEYSDGYSTGSGFVLYSSKDETLIATNCHVVEGSPYSISVWISEDEMVSASVLASSSQKDLCVLKLSYPISLKTLELCGDTAKQGEAVYAVGFPAAADYLSDTEAHTSADATVTDGIVSAIRNATVSEYGTAVQILQISAAINSGNSGGPLFNSKGEIVGINTFGIEDSQGIFGAISASEIIVFAADNQIPYRTAAGQASILPENMLLYVGIAVSAILIFSVVLIVRKKRMKKQKERSVTLRQYVQTNGALPHETAVSLLMPVAVQIRNLHHDGRVHLQISPDTIFVSKDGTAINNPSQEESDRYVTGFASPEIYSGRNAGNLSDIYSFCAVLSYTTTSVVPKNALERNSDMPDSVMEEANDAFCAIVQQGMSCVPQNRFATMQDLIYRLAPYNIGSQASYVGQNVQKKPKKKKRGRVVFALLGTVVVLAAAALGSYYYLYSQAASLAEQCLFGDAKKYLVVPLVTSYHDPNLEAYIDAGLLLEERNYQDAEHAFEKLNDYRDAKTMRKESKYRHAAQMADKNDFSNAIYQYKILKDWNYKDSEELYFETRYREGAYQLYQLCEYENAYKTFSKLSKDGYEEADTMCDEAIYWWACDLLDREKYLTSYAKLKSIRGYSDVDEILDALTEVIYYEGQDYYHENDYDVAEEYFECISSYSDSEAYLTLIKVHKMGSSFVSYMAGSLRTYVDDLIDLFYFEDASELLLSDTFIACEFLLGKWQTNEGGYYFEIEESDDEDYSFYSSYNLPWYGGTFDIENGIYCVSNDSYGSKPQYHFTLITPNSMEVYCYKDGSTYTLYR